MKNLTAASDERMMGTSESEADDNAGGRPTTAQMSDDAATRQAAESAVEHPTLVLVGINHNTAPVEVRERLSVPPGRLAEATRSLMQQPGIREAFVLSTCNRIELLVTHEAAQHPAPLARFLESYFAVPAALLTPHLYEYRDRDAVRHLFRVASSLDSMVVGEPQILGQVKESYAAAREANAVSSTLEALLQRTFSVAKRVRSETEIGASAVSIASVAVDLARKIFGSLHGKTVLLVGAGKMSTLAARHLIQHGASTILVTNRTQARAEELAREFLSSTASTGVIPFDQIYAQADRADIVITSTGSPEKIFERSHGQRFLESRRSRPMFFIDIAVPRDVDPRMNQVEGCFVYDIDDLQQVASSNLTDRSREAAAAESIIALEVERYLERRQQRDSVPAIVALQQSAETIREAELARTQARLASVTATLTASQQTAVQASLEALTRSLTAKLLHPQLTALRRNPPAKDE